MRSTAFLTLGSILACVLAAAACGEEGAPVSRRGAREEQLPRIKEIIAEDMTRHRRGIRDAAKRLTPGFVVELTPEQRERQMRAALKRVQEPPRGVPEFIASPMSFLAAVGADGIVIARDADPDAMKGMNFKELFPVVRTALTEGRSGFGMGEFQQDEQTESSWSMLFVAPCRKDGQIVGAVVAGIPLWRMAQRISTQIRLEKAAEINEGMVLWAYMYKGDRLFHFGDAPELIDIVPDGATRRAGLQNSPGGFTGAGQAHSRWYGWAVMPVPRIADDVGVIVLRGDPG